MGDRIDTDRQTDRHTHSPIVEVPQHFVLWDLKNVGPTRKTLYTLCKRDQLFAFICAADTILHQIVTHFKISKLWTESLSC
jgi:hypothetical protein